MAVDYAQSLWDGRGLMSENEARVWRQVGARLGEERRRRGLSKRAAAARAGFSEITWRQLEAGERQVSKEVKVPVSPKDETLVAAALAVMIDPAELFAMAGRSWEPPTDHGTDYNAEMSQVSPETKAAIDLLIEAERARERR